MGQYVPDVRCVLGERVAMQDAWRRGFESALTERVRQLGALGFSSADERAEWTGKMEILSGGKNTVKWVNDGAGTALYFPSVMVRIPAMRTKDVLASGTNENYHPAFVVNDLVNPYLYIGKYQGASIYSNTKHIGVSLYGVDVMGGDSTYTSLVGAQALGDVVTFDNCCAYCANGGTGFHLTTNAEFALLALLCKNVLSYFPKGNNDYGEDVGDADSPEYYGVPTYFYDSKIARVGAGTGPISWAHDGSPWGVYDLNGNIYEWVAGLRQVAGEVQVIKDNDAADFEFGSATKDFGRDSALWKALSSVGALVTPECTIDDGGSVTDSGAGATIKYNVAGATSGPVTLDLAVSTRTTTTVSVDFDDVAVDGVDIATVPELAVALGIAPPAVGGNLHGADKFYIRNDASGNYAETLPRRGAHWSDGAGAGVFYCIINYYRSNSNDGIGARPAFVENL